MPNEERRQKNLVHSGDGGSHGKLTGEMCSHGKPGDRVQIPVTVVIPCYRSAETIERAVDSVVNQTAQPIEIILVEDGNDDAGKTAGLLREIERRHASDVVCKVVTLPYNQGPAAARNAGWNAASQPFIAFLDADDAWHPRKLEIQQKWMESHPQAVLTGHLYITRREGNEWGQFPNRWNWRRVTRWHLLLRNRFPTPSVMLRREIDFRFDPARRYGEDYLLWLEILMAGCEAWRIELPLACSYKPVFGVAGLSANLWRMELGELATYRYFYQKKRIRLFTLWCLMMWSLVRYFRRIVRLPLQKMWTLKQ